MNSLKFLEQQIPSGRLMSSRKALANRSEEQTSEDDVVASITPSSLTTGKDFIQEVLNSMEQGILVWSCDAVCEMFNARIFSVLELPANGLAVGTSRKEFLDAAIARSELTQSAVDNAEGRFSAGQPFTFDRELPSGRIVSTNARPKSSGGFIVTFTDVTEARRGAQELQEAIKTAEEAQRKAHDALAYEQSRKKEARLLSELGEWLQSSKSLEELYDIIRSFLAKLFPDSSGELYIYSNSRDVLDGACSWNGGKLHDHIEADDCWALRRGRMYRYGKGLVDFTCNHVSSQSHTNEHEDCDPLSRYICLPIIAHGDTVGMLHLRLAPVEGEQDDSSEYKFVVQCAEQISLAVANVKLRDELRNQSIKDPLTGLYNRRYFLERFRNEIKNAEKNNRNVGLLSIDADHFKQFNDNHGHDAGDIVLRLISDALQTDFQEPFVAARIGGEEFSVLLPSASLEQSQLAAEALRKRIEKLNATCSGKRLPKVTISVGVATYPVHGSSPLELMKSADKALYLAKEHGRNCVRSPIDLLVDAR